MKSIIKWLLKIIIGFLLLIILSVLSYYALYKFRQSIKYNEKITVKAYYMMYACGDCSIDMKVEWVNNNKYKFLLGHDIFPTPQKKDFYKLCDYISNTNYKQLSSSPDAISKPFFLVGYLHKYPHGFLLDCSHTPYFTVEKMKYGDNGKWVEF
jgi:hypothetical protein